jgi:CBS domain-containing protein
MKVQDFMSRDVSTCRPEDTLSDAARIMWERDVGFVPVVDSNMRLCGVVTDRDGYMAAYFTGQPLTQVAVERTMSREVHTVAPETDLDEAEETMRRAQVRRIPVVAEGDRLVGVLSLNDIAVRAAGSAGRQGQVLRTNVAETLGAVSRHREPDRTGARGNGSHGEPAGEAPSSAARRSGGSQSPSSSAMMEA